MASQHGSRKTANGSMKYDLTQISEEEFRVLHTFVQACFDQGKQQFSPVLTRITNQNEGFDPHHMEYIAKDGALAVTLENRGDYQTRFQIWVTSAYKASFSFYQTLAHELVHGYAGLKYGHNAHWRRWYYRVMWHLIEAKMIPTPESPLREVCFQTGLGYNYTSAKAELDLIDEAFTKAEEEHDHVLQNYWKRINAPSRNHV